jgi:hypothetical protein
VGKVALTHRALYGGKATGRDFRNHLRSCMQFLNFTSCLADPDVWLRPEIKPDGTKCYVYVLLYTDDALVVNSQAEDWMSKSKTLLSLLPLDRSSLPRSSVVNTCEGCATSCV